MYSSEASVRLDSLDSTSIRVRRQPQQRRRFKSSISLCLEWCFSANIVTPTASTRPRSQSNSERCPYFWVEAACPRLNRLDTCKKPIYFMISLAKKGESSSPIPPISRLDPCCSLLHPYSYTTWPHPSAQKAGIPTNPLSPLLFILSSNRLCDKVLSEDAVSFNAPCFRAEVAPLFVSLSRKGTIQVSLQPVQNEETVHLIDLAFYLLIEN
jgi:hypothetical protein